MSNKYKIPDYIKILIKENPNLFFGFIGQYPNTLGQISDFKFALSQSKAQSSISILACDLLSLTLLNRQENWVQTLL